ncbi:hypothetical protein TNCV_1833971 [Trichonephila clavipes]|nr:hypothetical protein TNCV_1833971 [Trichonephila clavipes]
MMSRSCGSNNTAQHVTQLVPQSIYVKTRFGPGNWPPRSCDLSPLDYFVWGYVKSLVYADKPQTLDHLEENSPCYCRYTATNVEKVFEIDVQILLPSQR